MPSQASGDATSVARVEETLSQLWAQVAQAEGQDAITRATTLNLVVFATDPKEISAIIDSLTQEYPCRAIVIEVDGDAPDSLSASPTIYCHMALGSQPRSQVCCEEIRLVAGPGAVGRIPAAVEGLLLPDLPIFLYHQGDLSLLDPIVMHLGDIVDGIMVDSATFNDASGGLRNMETLFNNPRFKGKLHDLNWERLLHWRESLATATKGQAHDTLTGVREVEILHRAGRAEGLLILGWLASRLKWDLIPGGKDPNTWTAKGADAEITIRLKVMVSGPMGLQKLSLKTVSHSYEVQLSEDNRCLITRDGHTTTTPLQPPETAATLIGRAIEAEGRDAVFGAALTAAVTMCTQAHFIAQRAGVIVADSPESFVRLAARHFIQTARLALRHKGRFTVALSGGSTPKAVLALLAEPQYKDQIDWMKVHIFWGDERDVPTDHPDSNQRMAHEALLDKVAIPPGNIHGILTGRLSAELAASRYEAEIKAFFGLEPGQMPDFDLILLGMGDDGHTASLFPGTAALNAPAGAIFIANQVPKLQTTRLTLTAQAINCADNVVFWISGAAKADILYAVLEGPLTPDELPSQRIHPSDGNLTVLADQAAAARIRAEHRID